MAKFPQPPSAADLAAINPVTSTIKPGEMIYRIFSSAGKNSVNWRSFRHFGPLAARFDPHLSDKMGKPTDGSRGILYGAIGAEAIPTCLAEVFQSSRIIDRHAHKPVLCAFTLTRGVTLLDLSGAFTTRIGASMAINTGPRPRAQLWAQRLYDAYPDIDGILYASSMYANQPAIALFERAGSAINSNPSLHRLLSDPAMDDILINTAAVIGYQID
jgi:hypothetical protein